VSVVRFKFRCIILISGKIIKEIPGSVASGTPYRIFYDGLTSCFFQLISHNYLMGQGLVILDASRSHSDTPYSVGVLWTGDQTLQHTTHNHTLQHTTHNHTLQHTTHNHTLQHTTHNTQSHLATQHQNRHPSIQFKPAIQASKWPNIHSLDHEVTGIG